jgi:hypothetical protein
MITSDRSLSRRNWLKLIAGAAATQFASRAPAFSPTSSGSPPRKLRSDCYFGLHFDLHPVGTDTVLGRDLTKEMAASLLDQVKPDFVQYDCKGHPGWMGYPSAVQKSPPLVRDSLAIWRKVTLQHGVALYIHFSGVWDYLAAEQHPDWAALKADGKPDTRAMSVFGPYADSLMIPELEEAADRYELDGAWVDGDCWGVIPDYGPEVAQRFRASTGLSQLPKTEADPGWREFLEINREGYRDYVRRYVAALHRRRAGFQIASNWLYTTFVPERPEIEVDYLSGDSLGNGEVSRLRLEARYLASTGKTWDLMTWAFQSIDKSGLGFVYKPAVQMQQEASVVLAQGGAFQLYYTPTRAGFIDDRLVKIMATVSAFCRRRQEFCHHSQSVPQVGVLFSGYSLYRNGNRLFGPWDAALDPTRGILDALLENQLSVDILPDWQLLDPNLAGNSTYPLLVVPEWADIGQEAAQGLVALAKAGSSLMVIGARNARLFEDALGVSVSGEPSEQRTFVAAGEGFANVSGTWQQVEPRGAEVVLRRFPDTNSTRDGTTAASLQHLGKGRILGVYGPIGSIFADTHQPQLRTVVGELCARAITPKYRVEAPPTVEVVLRRKSGQEYLHLTNTTGMQEGPDYPAVSYIPPVGPIRILAPETTRLSPQLELGQVESRNVEGGVEVVLPLLHQHEVLRVS